MTCFRSILTQHVEAGQIVRAVGSEGFVGSAVTAGLAGWAGAVVAAVAVELVL